MSSTKETFLPHTITLVHPSPSHPNLSSLWNVYGAYVWTLPLPEENALMQQRLWKLFWWRNRIRCRLRRLLGIRRRFRLVHAWGRLWRRRIPSWAIYRIRAGIGSQRRDLTWIPASSGDHAMNVILLLLKYQPRPQLHTSDIYMHTSIPHPKPNHKRSHRRRILVPW